MEILPNHQTTFVVDRSQVIIVQAVGQTANLTYTAMSVAVIGRVEEIDVPLRLGSRHFQANVRLAFVKN